MFQLKLIGQEQVDSRIQEYLGEEITRKIVTQHPEQLNYYNNILFNSYELIKFEDAKEKNITIENITAIPLKNGSFLTYEKLVQSINDGSFNIFTLNLKRFKEKNRYFRIDDGELVFMLKAENRI